MSNIVRFPTRVVNQSTSSKSYEDDPFSYDFSGSWLQVLNDPEIKPTMLHAILDSEYSIFELSKAYALARYGCGDLRAAEAIGDAVEKVFTRVSPYITLREIPEMARGYLWQKNHLQLCFAWTFTEFELGSIIGEDRNLTLFTK